MVQIWLAQDGNPASLYTFGVSVGNGHQVLTFIDYEDYTPDGNLLEVRHGTDTYPASIKAIDPRTGVTLLEVDGSKLLPVAPMSDIDIPEAGNLYLSAWDGPDYTVLKEAKVRVVDYPNHPLFFNIVYDDMELLLREGSMINGEGSVVSDGTDVFGLVTTYRNELIIRSLYIGAIAPVAMIKSGRELLSPDVAEQTWTKGPAVVALSSAPSFLEGYLSGMLTDEADYEDMTVALLDLFGTIGEQIDVTELGLDFTTRTWYWSTEGTMLIAVYPRPVALHDPDSTVLAQAKWVAVAWNSNDDNPAYLVYGTEPYNIQGGYYLNGDITALAESLHK
ncbi:hypothetical protein ACFLXA_06795 [Chloroflexota bacterium]